MAIIKITCLKAEININDKIFPLYTGFLSAKEILEIATVPSFEENKSHLKIAKDSISPPVDEWQRPQIREKINKIKDIYNSSTQENLMPNPVLLGTAYQHYERQKIKIDVEPVSIGTGSQKKLVPDLFEIKVKLSDDNPEKKPIWIIDGQHRIVGLSQTVQSENKVPFVLLHEEEKKEYEPSFLAEIFTHVTTGATKMEKEHQEWMKFAFDLDKYSEESHKEAMKTVMELCIDQQSFLFDKIKFNPHLQSTGYYSFMYDCIKLKDIIQKNYYSKNTNLIQQPKKLAKIINDAVISFKAVDINKDNESKIFPGDNVKPHTNLADAFLTGLLNYLVDVSDINKIPKDKTEWETFFRERDAHRNDWRLSWIQAGQLSSGLGVISKKVAISCFVDFFSEDFNTNLGGEPLTSFLQNHGGLIKVTVFNKDARGRMKSTEKKEYKLSVGISPNHASYNVNLWNNNTILRYIRVESIKSNVAILKISDTNHTSRNSVDITRLTKGKNNSFDSHQFGEWDDNNKFDYKMAVEHQGYSGASNTKLLLTFKKQVNY